MALHSRFTLHTYVNLLFILVIEYKTYVCIGSKVFPLLLCYVSLQFFRIRLPQIQLKTFKSLIPGGDKTEARSRPVITTLSNTLACTCMVENGHEEHPASDQTQIQYWVTAALFPTAKM